MGIKINLLATAALVAMPYIASAADFDHAYVSGAGAWSVLEDENVRAGATNGEAEFKDGWGVLGAVGAKMGHVRTELELGYRDNKVKSLNGFPAGGNGKNQTWTVMANGIYDFDNASRFTPYLGLGVGVARVKYDDVALNGTTVIDDSSVRPAAQGIAGVSYKINDNFNLFTNYQYLTTSRYKVKSESGNGVGTDQYRDHAVLAGLTYKFGHRHPAPVTATSASYTKEEATRMPDNSGYNLFFDWNSARLTAEGREVLNQAARKAKNMQNVTIEVTGHADTSGTQDYNQKLSEKRAQEVKRALVQQGIPANEITVYAKGETDPLVATGDGVREVQNRRVVIVYATK